MTDFLPPRFFLRDTARVARDLLGKGLVRTIGERDVVCEIAEVEAYLGADDQASHSRMGPTRRNQSMFLPGGVAYVYLSHGIHYCMNVVTREEGRGEAVLIRAVSPVQGLDVMAARRGLAPDARGKALYGISNGPGKLAQALAIDLTLDGQRLDGRGLGVVDLGRRVAPREVGISPRIGISRDADLPLRFFLKDSVWLSR